MTKTRQDYDRSTRHLRRQLSAATSQVSQCRQNTTAVTKRAVASARMYKKHLHLANIKNSILRENIQSLHELFTEQQQRLRQQQVIIDKLKQVEHVKRNPALTPGTYETAVSMIAMSQQVCASCLGTGTISKQKKNIRYNVTCQACINPWHRPLILYTEPD